MPQPTPAIASIDVGTVRQRFNWEWTADPDSFDGADTYWWWARSIRVDPNEIIADDDEGGLWAIPFTTDGADEVTFGAPVRVRETYVPVDGDGVAATAAVTRRRQRVAAAALSRPNKPTHPEHPRASTGPQGQEEHTMSDLTALRAEYGIAEDVTDDEIGEVLSALADDGDEEPEATAATDDPPPDDDEGGATAQPPTAASSPATEAENAALRATVERLASQEAARAQREAAETRESVLSAAVREGRITPHERTSLWEAFYDADPDKATASLAALPANRHHVVEVGHAGGADTDPEAAAFASRRARLTGRKEATNA